MKATTNSEDEEDSPLSILYEFVYNDKEIDWQYWVQSMPKLNTKDASRLMCGLDPDIFKYLSARPNKNDPSRLTTMANDIERLAEAEKLDSKTPEEWLEWAIARNFNVYTGFNKAVIERRKQREGRYTLENAALAVSQGSGERYKDILRKLMEAAENGTLLVYEPGRNARYEYGQEKASCVREFYEEAYWNDLNSWLETYEPRIAFRFPKPVADSKNQQTETAPSKTLNPPPNSKKQITKIVKSRSNILDPAIDKAIEKSKSLDFNKVFPELREQALNQEQPFTGQVDADGLAYTHSNGTVKALTMGALRKRLKRRQTP